MGKSAIRRNLPVAVLGLAAVGLGAAAMTLGNGDAVVERGFQRALRRHGRQAAPGKAALPVVAGSEEFWLTHLVHDAGGAITKPVAVGDRITINSGGRERVLQRRHRRQARQPGAADLVRAADAAAAGDLPRRGESARARPVRFLIEAGDELPALSSAKAARTL